MYKDPKNPFLLELPLVGIDSMMKGFTTSLNMIKVLNWESKIIHRKEDKLYRASLKKVYFSLKSAPDHRLTCPKVISSTVSFLYHQNHISQFFGLLDFSNIQMPSPHITSHIWVTLSPVKIVQHKKVPICLISNNFWDEITFQHNKVQISKKHTFLETPCKKEEPYWLAWIMNQHTKANKCAFDWRLWTGEAASHFLQVSCPIQKP